MTFDHNHPGERLSFGCDACLDRVRRDQRRARWTTMSDDDLMAVWDTDLEGTDNEFVGLLLVERGRLRFDEFADAIGLHVTEEAS